MKKIISLIVIICVVNIQTYAEDVKLPAISINNLCESQFPLEARNDYNHPQYKLGYDRCTGAYKQYIDTIEQAIKDWKIASNGGKKEDWDRAESGYNIAYEIMNINGENLVGWLNRDILLTNIIKYIKAVKEHVILYVPEVAKETPLILTGSIVKKDEKNLCNPGFIVIPKTGKCRKLLKKKISSILK
ncbi:hypothetical protein HOO68_03230 [Candidatus Gracilibacteria bacterium]|nr:hypothetical protein [Candidatus Gracilibacteria bacterium]